MFQHAAHDYTAHDLLLAYLAERIEALAERMALTGYDSVAVFGSRDHTAWLVTNINSLNTLPITAFVDRPDEADEPPHLRIPILRIDDPRLTTIADTVLISDDRCEADLVTLAERHAAPDTLVWPLYKRFDIAKDPLPAATPRPAEDIEPKAHHLITPTSTHPIHYHARVANLSTPTDAQHIAPA